MDDAKQDAPHDYRYSPAPSPPSMVAAPCEAAMLDKLSIIDHHLRRSPALLERVFAAVQADQQRIRDGAELPPPIKPHPPSDPLSAKRNEAEQETVRS